MFRRQMLRVIWAWLAGGLYLAIPTAEAIEPQKDDVAAKVRVVVNYGDGVEKHFTEIAWKKGMTAFDAMKAAQAHPRGIRFEYRGQGATTFLTKIDDLANQAKERNWIYRVNGKLGNQSFGTYELTSGDVVLWSYQ